MLAVSVRFRDRGWQWPLRAGDRLILWRGLNVVIELDGEAVHAGLVLLASIRCLPSEIPIARPGSSEPSGFLGPDPCPPASLLAPTRRARNRAARRSRRGDASRRAPLADVAGLGLEPGGDVAQALRTPRDPVLRDVVNKVAAVGADSPGRPGLVDQAVGDAGDRARHGDQPRATAKVVAHGRPATPVGASQNQPENWWLTSHVHRIGAQQ